MKKTSPGGDCLKDILVTITNLREARGWTEYQLAENAGLPQSTISSWYRKKMIPTVPSLMKICNAFGITLSQLFSDEDSLFELTDMQKRLLSCWSCLNLKQQEALLEFLERI